MRSPSKRLWTLIALLIRLPLSGLAQSEATLPQESHLVPVNGIEMHYEDHGQGEPLVLLHGFTGSSQAWSGYIPKFKEHYRVIVPDLRGHGRSTNPSGKFTHRQAALDVYALLDHLGIDRFRGIGTSTGAMTLIHMATQQPRRPEAVILAAGTIYFPEPARDIMRRSTAENISDEQWESYRRQHFHGDEQIRQLRQAFHDFRNSYDDMNFTPPYLATIQARVLIVHGDRDKFFPIEIPVQMYQSIPNSYLWIVPNKGHNAIGGEREFPRLALEFFEDKWDPAPR